MHPQIEYTLLVKGLILAGGNGTRLWPLTQSISKQLVPVYDKPLIYYPLSTLMSAGIRDIGIITTPKDQPAFKALLGDGSAFGITITYLVQPKPEGLAQAFIIGEEFIGNSSVCLILGDNIFHGADLDSSLKRDFTQSEARIFAYEVDQPQEYGVVEFDETGRAISIEEKPVEPKSKFAVPGIYFYQNSVIEIAKKIKPSNRNELEITEVNNHYLNLGQLEVVTLARGTAWLDTGNVDAMFAAANYVKVIEDRQGRKIGCPEEIAFSNNWIDKEQLTSYIQKRAGNSYMKYLASLIQ
jgi:glucose-1-phosphate thymidylyltransferase